MSTLLAIVTSVGILATMRALLKEENETDEVRFEAFVSRLALRDFNARMRAAGMPGYWPLSE